MNIQRLKTLANVIEPGVVEFPEMGLNIAFNMECTFETQTSWYVPMFRPDIPDWRKINACACLAGFTILLFSPLKHKLMSHAIDFNILSEASMELGLSRQTGIQLFYETLDRNITGADAARVVRRLILSECVDWAVLHE